MLPSTGHFKGVNCPFLESGLCERPYCHFRHARRPSGRPAVPDADRKPLSVAVPVPASKPTYNPTPISELNKSARKDDGDGDAVRRHIPVPYTPRMPHTSRPLASPEGYVPFGGPAASSATYNPGGAALPRDEPAYSPVSETTPIVSSFPFPFAPGRTFMRYKPTPLKKDEPPPSVEEGEPATKKSKTEEVDFEGLEPEFELLGEILEDEETDPETEPKRRLGSGKTNGIKVEEERKRASESRSKSSLSEDFKDKKGSKRSEEKTKKRHSLSKDRDKKSSKTRLEDSVKRRESSSHKSKSDRSKKDDRSKTGRSDKRRDSAKDGSIHKSKENGSSKRSGDHKSDRKSKTREKSKETKRLEIAPTKVDDYFSASESDEDRINEECLKIFEEYVPAPKEKLKTPSTSEEITDDSNVLNNKKRTAHLSDQPIRRPPPASLPPDHKANAVQLAANRYNQVKKFHEARLKSEESSININTNKSIKRDFPLHNTSSSSKTRIAHVPYALNMLDAKKKLVKVTEPPKTTIVQTVSKGTNRIAHIPNDKFCDRPSVLEPLASKILVTVRTKYLNMMIDECLKIYLSLSDAYERAQQEELTTSKKCSTTQIYKNSAVLTIARLRKEVQETNELKKTIDKGISHNQILVGKIGEKASWSIENKFKKNFLFSDELKGVKFYDNISRWILTEKELQENGFPRPHPNSKEKGRAIIYTKNTKQKPQKGYIRTCCRCGKEYKVDKRGLAVLKEECIYHPNNKYRFRGEVKYQCCGQDASSDGCLSASCHVHEYVNHDDLRGFVTTLPKDNSDSVLDHGVYALDCEMCYTTHGLDLTRVTVIDSSCKVIYETLVKPIYPIIDYNTRYSGLTEEMLKDCNTSLLEVQATFLHMFSDKTILVGHSLESDLKALKIVHNSVVDTSVLFPHKMGLPYKRALRNLSSEYLKKIIQNSVDGHDSAEDALVCMELIIWKLKEELKLR